MFKHQHAKYLYSITNTILVIAFLSACSPSDEVNEKTNDYYQSANIEKIFPNEFYEITREYIGKVASKQMTSLSFEYGGTINKIYNDSGDIVSKGQLLAELNTDLLAIKHQEVDAIIKQLNAQAHLNKLNLSRVNELIKQGYSSKQRLDELQTEQKIIAADLSRQQANKSVINYQISKAKLYAPFDAIVSNRLLDDGEILKPNQTAFELIKKSHYEILVGVPVKVADKLIIGQELDVELGQQHFAEKIIAIGKQVNQISRTVELRLSITKPLTIYNDQLATVKISQRVNEQGFWVPISALTDGIRGQWNIFSVKGLEDNLYTIIATTVNVKYTTVDKAYISGLPIDSQNVIVSGVHRFVPTQIVKKAQKLIATEKSGHTL